jgi:hypothetical protein
MTQLLSLWNEVFAQQSKTANLEQFINSHNPASEHDVEELTRDYLFHYSTLRGL